MSDHGESECHHGGLPGDGEPWKLEINAYGGVHRQGGQGHRNNWNSTFCWTWSLIHATAMYYLSVFVKRKKVTQLTNYAATIPAVLDRMQKWPLLPPTCRLFTYILGVEASQFFPPREGLFPHLLHGDRCCGLLCFTEWSRNSNPTSKPRPQRALSLSLGALHTLTTSSA